MEFLATVSVYPNPSNAGSEISFSLSEKTDAEILITDISGRIIEVVEKNTLTSGSYRYSFGNALNAGVYFVKFRLNGSEMTEKVVLTR